MTRLRRLVLILILTILFANAFLALPYSHQLVASAQGTPPNNQQLLNAADYLANRFDARLGLVSESEDTGSNVPDGTPCYRTYWIYSDNIWTSPALEPFYPQTSQTINTTTALYIAEYGYGEFHEVVLGIKTPLPPHAGTRVKVDTHMFNGANHTVWLDRHRAGDGGIFYDANDYADLLLYRALNNYLDGNLTGAETSLRLAERMWRDNGFYDKAAQNEGRYHNYKLGLYLFTVKATGVTSPIQDAVERTAWSNQKTNGGIATQSYFNGTIYGTANVETTSVLLLAYNPKLALHFVRKAYESKIADHSKLEAETELLRRDLLEAQRALQKMGSEYERLKKELDNLQTSYRTLNETYLFLTKDYESIQQSYRDLQVALSHIATDLGIAITMTCVLAVTIVALSLIIIYRGTGSRKAAKGRLGTA